MRFTAVAAAPFSKKLERKRRHLLSQNFLSDFGFVFTFSKKKTRNASPSFLPALRQRAGPVVQPTRESRIADAVAAVIVPPIRWRSFVVVVVKQQQ